jgi:hypothetical protein
MHQIESTLEAYLERLTLAVNRNTESLRRVEKQLSLDSSLEDRNISIREFMKIYDVSRSSVERHKRELGFFKFGNKLYIKQSRIEEIEKNGGFKF